MAGWRRGDYAGLRLGGGARDLAVRRALAAIVPLDRALPRAVAAVFAGPHPRPLDLVQVDYYDPVAGHHLRFPGRRWDDRVDPPGLASWLKAHAGDGLGVEVAENGLCNRVVGGRARPRRDGWDRVRYLHANLAAVVDALQAGVPVTGYFHWTLADNYEWGSYQPRFGLYGVDRAGSPRAGDRDSFGGEAAATYRRLAAGLRDGDLSVLGRRLPQEVPGTSVSSAKATPPTMLG